MKSILYIFAFLIPVGINAEDLVMKITNPQVNGNQVVYDLVTDHFTDLVSIQYTISYDTNRLIFAGIQNINLPQLTEDNFYGGIPGVITSLWYDQTLQGTSVSDGTILYQIVFNMKNGAYGGVCFSDEPLESEFARVNNVLNSYFIVDDCHADPYEVNLTTTTQEIADRFGLNVFTIARDQKIVFALTQQQSIEFHVFDLNGQRISVFPKHEYSTGQHTLNLNRSIVPGIYILTTEIDHQPAAFKIFYQ
ncbi:MAG: T9SS type A sorting domain-containing protein [Saprospiraceae bacterium]